MLPEIAQYPDSPRFRRKHAAHIRAAMHAAIVDGEYPLDSSHLSCAVAGRVPDEISRLPRLIR